MYKPRNLISAFTYMKDKFEYIIDDTLKTTIEEEYDIARTYGPSALGLARMAKINPIQFPKLFPNATLEAFSTPFSSYLPKFASTGDVDAVYGSVGDIFKYNITENIVAAHPPNEPEVIMRFIRHVLSSDRTTSLKLYMFIPDWDNIENVIGPLVPYITNNEHFSFDRMRSERTLLNGCPEKFNIPWIPQKERRLFTFDIPASVFLIDEAPLAKTIVSAPDNTTDITKNSHYIGSDALNNPSLPSSNATTFILRRTKPYNDMDVHEKIKYNVDALCGIGTPGLIRRGHALEYKLKSQYSGHYFSLDGSKLPYARQLLNELILDYVPSLTTFWVVDSDHQEEGFLQMLSIARGYCHLDPGSTVLMAVDQLYQLWMLYQVDQSSIDEVHYLWHDFINTVLNEWVSIITALLSNYKHTFYVDTVAVGNVSEITFDLDNPQELLVNGIPSNTNNINGLYFMTSSIVDRIGLDRLYDLHRGRFSSLLVVSYESDVIKDIVDRYEDIASTCRRFNSHLAFLTYLVVTDVDAAELEESINNLPITLVDAETCHINIGNNYIGIPPSGYALLELFGRMWLQPWLWFENDFTLIYKKVMFCIQLSNYYTTDISTSGVKLLVLAFQILADYQKQIEEVFSFAALYPVVRHRGGDGIDLFQNCLPHTLSTLMFMVEFSSYKLIAPTNLEMNMLHRHVVKIGELVDEKRYNETAVYKYKWVYSKNKFHSVYPSEMEKELRYVYFFEKWLPSSGRYVTLQILHSAFRGKWIIEYVHPKDPTNVISRPSQVGGETVDDINSFFSSFVVEPDRVVTNSHFPNLHINREIDESRLGIKWRNLMGLLQGNQELHDWLEGLELGVAPMHSVVNSVLPPSSNHDRDNEYVDNLTNHGYVVKVLNLFLSQISVYGWVPRIVNAVPRYYFDVYRNLSNSEYTLAGDRIPFHTARVVDGNNTLFPCPGSNFVWNCKIGHLLSGACIRSLRMQVPKNIKRARNGFK